MAMKEDAESRRPSHPVKQPIRYDIVLKISQEGVKHAHG